MRKRYLMVCEMTPEQWQQVADHLNSRHHTQQTPEQVEEFVTDVVMGGRLRPLEAPVVFDFLRKNRPTRAEALRQRAMKTEGEP